MDPVEQLRDHKDTLLAGTWVQELPHEPGEGCAVFRVVSDVSGYEDDVNSIRLDDDNEVAGFELVLGTTAIRALAWAIAERGDELIVSPPFDAEFYELRVLCAIQVWNDAEGRLFSTVSDVFDRAIVIAKEVTREAA